MSHDTSKTPKKYTSMENAIALAMFIASNADELQGKSLGTIRKLAHASLGDIHFSDTYLKASLRKANVQVRKSPSRRNVTKDSKRSNTQRLVTRMVVGMAETIEKEIGCEP